MRAAEACCRPLRVQRAWLRVVEDSCIRSHNGWTRVTPDPLPRHKQPDQHLHGHQSQGLGRPGAGHARVGVLRLFLLGIRTRRISCALCAGGLFQGLSSLWPRVVGLRGGRDGLCVGPGLADVAVSHHFDDGPAAEMGQCASSVGRPHA